jgi:5-formyltetrahydrofolate cyclo-ligase
MAGRRGELSEAARLELSTRAQARLVALPEFKVAKAIGLYRALGKEVSTAELAQAAWSSAKDVAFPVLGGAQMTFVVVGPSTPFQKSPLGFEEPLSGAPVEVAELDLLVIPALAFDTRGNRLGRGQGHYDRALANATSRPICVGLGYDFQLVTPWTPEAHDRPMQWVVTEARALKVGPAPSAL